jgi:hypothetical protein
MKHLIGGARNGRVVEVEYMANDNRYWLAGETTLNY